MLIALFGCSFIAPTHANVEFTIKFVATTGGTISATYLTNGVQYSLSSVTSVTVQADNGSPIFITATATPGYHFVSMNDTDADDAMWSSGAQEVDQAFDYSVTTVTPNEVDANANMYIYVNFAANPTFTEKFMVAPSNGGTITPTTGQFLENSWQALTAVPAVGYHFVNWTNTDQDDSPFSTPSV